jgi:uncharacterized protein YigA (DUF484 family)
MTSPKETMPAPLRARAVEEFLRENPDWLSEHIELYRVLTPPVRVHGDILADHMAAMLQAERLHAAAMTRQASEVLAARRSGAGMAARVQVAVLALLRALVRQTSAVAWVADELPGLLGLDAAALCVESPEHAVASHGGLERARALPPGTVDRLLGARAVLVRDRPGDTGLLHGEAAPLARIDALVRMPLAGPPALLALAARQRGTLHPRQGESALGFLAQALAAAMDRLP